MVPSSRESVSYRQAMLTSGRGMRWWWWCGWCVVCVLQRVAGARGGTHSQRAGKLQSCTQANRQSRKGEETEAQAWPIKTQHSFPQCACPWVTKLRQGRKRTRKRKKNNQHTNKKNDKNKQSINLKLSVFFFCFFLVAKYFGI